MPQEMGIPSMRRHLLDQDEHKEPGTLQEPRTQRRLPEDQRTLPHGDQRDREEVR